MIGVLDSGLGGLRVLREIRRLLPSQDLVYFGDSARGPYGSRSPETVATYLQEGLSRLAALGAERFVVADHAAAASLSDEIRQNFKLPILDILNDGILPSLPCGKKAFGLVAPPAVVWAGTYDAALRCHLPEARVHTLVETLWEAIIETGRLKKAETILTVKKALHALKVKQIDTLVLGSNHYGLLAEVIQRKIGLRVSLVDGAAALARSVRDAVPADPDGEEKTGTLQAFMSDLTPALLKNAKVFYGQNITLERTGRG